MSHVWILARWEPAVSGQPAGRFWWKCERCGSSYGPVGHPFIPVSDLRVRLRTGGLGSCDEQLLSEVLFS